MKSRILALAALLGSLLSPLPVMAWEKGGMAENPGRRSFEIYGWRSELSGNTNLKNLVMDFDADGDFKPQNRFSARFATPLGNRRDHLALTVTTFDHDGTIQKGVTFDNQKYNPGAHLRLQTSWVEVDGSRRLSSSKNGSLEALAGWKFSRATVDIDEPVGAATKSGSWNQKFGIPFVGIGGRTAISENLWAHGSIKYISLDIGGVDVSSHDLDIGLEARLSPRDDNPESEWAATLGYRNFSLRGTVDNDTIEIGYAGPTLGIRGSF